MPLHRFGLVLFVCLSAALVGWSSQRSFARQGDGWEYLAMTEAWVRHGSPDVRAGDIEAMFAGIDRAAGSAPGQPSAAALYGAQLPHGFATAPDGSTHALHFWMYSLAAVPAKIALRLFGGREFNALVVTNAWMFAAAIGVALGAGPGSFGQRAAFVLLATVTPVLWYLTFTGVEVFSWALGVIALIAVERRWYWQSALAAALAATQNPPMVLLALLPVLLPARRREWGAAAAALAASSLALLPVVWTWSRFGTPTLIAATLDAGRLSPARTWSLLIDLNVGLLPYVPVLCLGAPWGAWRAGRRGDVAVLLLVVAVAGMLLGMQMQINWNTDGRGLRRYLVWVLPAMAWVVARAWRDRALARWVAAAVVTSGAVLLFEPPSDMNWLEHRPLARWVLREWPAFYDPDFEIFTERSAHGEAPPHWLLEGVRRDGWMLGLPVAHGRASGEVTKLLVHRDSAAELPRRFRIDPAYLPELRRRAEAATTPVYVEPPPGTVWAAAGSIDGRYRPYSGPPVAPDAP